MKRIKYIVVLFSPLLFNGYAFGHSGDVNQLHCHNDNKGHGYHCSDTCVLVTPQPRTTEQSGNSSGDLEYGAPAQIYSVQTMLGMLGFEPGEADGLLGSKTVSAIKHFQQSVGYANPTGKLDNDLIAQLARAIECANSAREQ